MATHLTKAPLANTTMVMIDITNNVLTNFPAPFCILQINHVAIMQARQSKKLFETELTPQAIKIRIKQTFIKFRPVFLLIKMNWQPIAVVTCDA